MKTALALGAFTLTASLACSSPGAGVDAATKPAPDAAAAGTGGVGAERDGSADGDTRGFDDDAPADRMGDVGGDLGAPDATDARTAAGTIVPLYTYPSDPSWTAIVTAKQAHPAVRVVAVVNPNSGPGSARLTEFTTGIAKLEAAHIEVIGYIATGYASHSIASMEAAIDSWRLFYPQLEGIFFDEQSDKAADVAYYRSLSQYAKAHGLGYTVGNPGADTAEAFVGALDTMLIYESKGLPDPTKLGGWHTKYAPENFGVIPFGAGFDAAFVAAARKSVGFVYVQNDDLPNPWDTLPPFFGDLLAALE